MTNGMIANRYVLVQLIGEGGMASVYLAIDTILKREVAVKILRGELSKDPVALTRFQREANATTKLSHPNVVEVYDVGEDDGKYFIVMEYIKGRSLKELVQKRGALPKEEAVNIMKQLVSAVSIAHKNGIIHRDIKSQNVLIKDDGTVKLSDFGIALANDATQLTQTDVVVGSVHYLAPELARGDSATQQSDIYSLGIVFYEMVIGDVPHHGDAPVQVALKHMRESIPSVKEFVPSLPQSIDNIVAIATAKNKEFRYISASEMYDDLVTCLDVSRAKEPKVVFEDDEDDSTDDIPMISKKKGVGGIVVNSVIIGGVLIFAALAMAFIVFLNGGSLFPPKIIPVPDVTGYTIEQATEMLEEAGFKVSPNYKMELTEDIEENLVAGTTPGAGVDAEKGSVVFLIVSSGTYYKMPDLTGWLIDDVISAFEDCCNIRVIKEWENTTSKEVGIIVNQSIPEGETVHPTRLVEITLTITRNPEFQIPVNIEGMKIADAQKALEALGGVVKITKQTIPLIIDTNCTIVPDGTVDGDGNPIPPNDCRIPDPNVKVGVVVSSNPAVGSFYTQTKESYITLFYY